MDHNKKVIIKRPIKIRKTYSKFSARKIHTPEFRAELATYL